MNEMCWFCQRREADLSTTLMVKMRKETRTQLTASKIEVKSETKNIIVPRCSQCASIQKKKNRLVPILSIIIFLSGLMSLLILLSIGSNHDIPDWLPTFGCIAVPVFLLVLYFVWENNRVMRLSPEQRQDNKDAQKSALKHPEVDLLYKEGYTYISYH